MSRRHRARAAGRISQAVVEALEERRLFGIGRTDYNFTLSMTVGTGTQTKFETFNFSPLTEVPEHDALWVNAQAWANTGAATTVTGTAGTDGAASLSGSIPIGPPGDRPMALGEFAGNHSGNNLTLDYTFNPSGYATAALGTAYDFYFIPDNPCDPSDPFSSKPVRYKDGAAKLQFDDFAGLTIAGGDRRDWSNISYTGDQPGGKISRFGVAGAPWIQMLLEGDYQDQGQTLPYKWIGVIWNSTDVDIIFHHGSGNGQSYALQRDGIDGKLQFIPDTVNHTWRLIEGSGREWVFADFSSYWTTAQKGTLLKVIAPGGFLSEVTAWENNLVKRMRATYPAVNGSGAIIDEFEYTYATGTDRIDRIKLSRGTTGSLTAIRTVDYTYYTTAGSHGSVGDLKYVTIRDGDESSTIREKQYYRWYTSDTSTSYTGGLKLWLSGDSYRKAVQALVPTNPDDIESQSDTDVKNYADNYFEYGGTTKRVTKEIAQGAGCSCAGTDGRGEFTFEYPTTNSGTGGDLNTWAQKTIEYLPDHTASDLNDNNQNIVYTNQRGQPAGSQENARQEPHNRNHGRQRVFDLLPLRRAGSTHAYRASFGCERLR